MLTKTNSPHQQNIGKHFNRYLSLLTSSKKDIFEKISHSSLRKVNVIEHKTIINYDRPYSAVSITKDIRYRLLKC